MTGVLPLIAPWDPPGGRSEADDLADGAGDLVEGVTALGLRRAHGVDDAVLEVIGQEPGGDFLQGPGRGSDLDYYVGAPGVGLDHLLQAAHLASTLRSRVRQSSLPEA